MRVEQMTMRSFIVVVVVIVIVIGIFISMLIIFTEMILFRDKSLVCARRRG